MGPHSCCSIPVHPAGDAGLNEVRATYYSCLAYGSDGPLTFRNSVLGH